VTEATIAPAAKPLVLRTSIGKKYAMAASGIILVGFVIVHAIGLLKFFTGAEHFDEYSVFLRTVGAPALPHYYALWGLRIVLLAAVSVHIWAAYMTTRQSHAARPIPYAHKDTIQASYASRTMRWGGVIILIFVIYHLLHFTTGQAHPDFVPGDPYHNFVSGFRVWWVSAFYILANLALGLHLYHGVWAMFSSLGVTHSRFENWRRGFATVFAVIVTLGNISFPLSVLLGIVR